MSRSETPSAISSAQDSGQRPFDSHESLGFRRASLDRVYTLPMSPTPQEPLDTPLDDGVPIVPVEQVIPTSPPSVINPGDESYGPVGDIASLPLPASSDAPPSDADMDRSFGTTRVLQHAAAAVHGRESSQAAFTLFPPRGVRHRNYAEYAAAEELPTPEARYTQVLIWCLQRRIVHLQRSPPQDLPLSQSLQLTSVLRRVQGRLSTGEVVPRWRTHEALHLKPQTPNPENFRSAQVLSELTTYRERLLGDARASWRSLQESEAEPTAPLLQHDIETETPVDVYADIAQHARGEPMRAVQHTLERMVELDGLSEEASALVAEELSRRQHDIGDSDPLTPRNMGLPIHEEL